MNTQDQAKQFNTTAQADEQALLIENITQLVASLCRELPANHPKRVSAMEFVKRNGLMSPLRFDQ